MEANGLAIAPLLVSASHETKLKVSLDLVVSFFTFLGTQLTLRVPDGSTSSR